MPLLRTEDRVVVDVDVGAFAQAVVGAPFGI